MQARSADKNQVISVFRDDQPRNACADAIRISWPHTGTQKRMPAKGKGVTGPTEMEGVSRIAGAFDREPRGARHASSDRHLAWTCLQCKPLRSRNWPFRFRKRNVSPGDKYFSPWQTKLKMLYIERKRKADVYKMLWVLQIMSKEDTRRDTDDDSLARYTLTYL